MNKFLIILIFSFMSVSCSTVNKTTNNSSNEGQSISKDSALELNGDSDSNRAGGLQTIHFDYRSSQLTDKTKKILDENAAFLSSHPEIEIQIEGHADERGSAQFNLALGEKRAKTVMIYLSSRGITHSRMTIISYGKEKPVDILNEEDSWAKNRRANFLITKL